MPVYTILPPPWLLRRDTWNKKEEHTIHKYTGSYPSRGGTDGTIGDALQHSLHQYYLSKTVHWDQPHHPVTFWLQQGKLILVLPIQLRKKQHPSEYHNGKYGKRLPPNLLITSWSPHNKGIQTIIYEARQRVIYRLTEHPEWKNYQLPAGNYQHAPTKLSGEGLQNPQGPFHCGPLIQKSWPPHIELGPPTRSSGNSDQRLMYLKTEAKDVGVREIKQHVWLQLYPHGTTMNK